MPAEETIKGQGLVLILRELHDTLDALVFEAYGWPATLTAEKILERLVALNKLRARRKSRQDQTAASGLCAPPLGCCAKIVTGVS